MKLKGITLDVEMASEDSEEEKQATRPSKRSSSLYKVKDTYLTKEEYNIATGKGLSSRYSSHISNDCNNPYYPNLQVLTALLPLSAI